jgi:hypothetical protein
MCVAITPGKSGGGYSPEAERTPRALGSPATGAVYRSMVLVVRPGFHQTSRRGLFGTFGLCVLVSRIYPGESSHQNVKEHFYGWARVQI